MDKDESKNGPDIAIITWSIPIRFFLGGMIITKKMLYRLFQILSLLS